MTGILTYLEMFSIKANQFNLTHRRPVSDIEEGNHDGSDDDGSNNNDDYANGSDDDDMYENSNGNNEEPDMGK